MNDDKIINKLKVYFHRHFKEIPESVENISAGASDRNIFRLKSRNNNCIGVYNENVYENAAFTGFAASFIKNGFRVPKIFKISRCGKYYLEQDLGDFTLTDFLNKTGSSDNKQILKKVIDDLIMFQTAGKKILDFSLCYQTKRFDSGQMRKDIRKFISFCRSISMNKISIKDLQNFLHLLASKLSCQYSNYFLYRDFQPRNIMIYNNEPYYIDFQSGRYGAIHYDLASFLYSGSISINEKTRTELLKYYIQTAGKIIDIQSDFIKLFYDFVLIRLIQMMGSYTSSKEKIGNDILKYKLKKAIRSLNSISGKCMFQESEKVIKILTKKEAHFYHLIKEK